jgi:predicted MFS family arabinose efflux permease
MLSFFLSSLSADPFLADLALVVFVYYTSVWAMVSTLMLFLTRHLHFSTVSLGWLLSAYGLATMFSEAVLVRIIVPRIGEINSMMFPTYLSFFISLCLLLPSLSAFKVGIGGLFSAMSSSCIQHFC